MPVVNNENGVRKMNKWTAFILSIVTLISLIVGGVAGMVIKSQKIDAAYECAKENERSIHALRETMIRIDENVNFIKQQMVMKSK